MPLPPKPIRFTPKIMSKIKVDVVLALTDKVVTVSVELASGASIADAIAASNLAHEYPHINAEDQAVGIFSRRATLTTPVTDGDRVELYAPLTQDPNQRRQQRT